MGMGLMAIQVVNVEGSPASPGQLFGRALLLAVDVGITPLIGLVTMLVSSRNQRIVSLRPLAPAGIGLNVRFLQKRGVDQTVAVLGVGRTPSPGSSATSRSSAPF
jgi:hypothetical protein